MAKGNTFTKILVGVGLAGLGAAALNHFCNKAKKDEEEIEEVEYEIVDDETDSDEE